MKISRRSFLKTATAFGASLAWAGPARGSRVHWHERRDLYPQGVARAIPIRTASSCGRGIRLAKVPMAHANS
jgi:alkaline phosphatase D